MSLFCWHSPVIPCFTQGTAEPVRSSTIEVCPLPSHTELYFLISCLLFILALVPPGWPCPLPTSTLHLSLYTFTLKPIAENCLLILANSRLYLDMNWILNFHYMLNCCSFEKITGSHGESTEGWVSLFVNVIRASGLPDCGGCWLGFCVIKKGKTSEESKRKWHTSG